MYASSSPDHDLYNMCAGVTVLWGISVIARYIINDVAGNINARSLLTVIMKWTSIALKVLILGSIWMTVIPLLVGLLFEAVAVVPLRVNENESPMYPVMQSWALGLVFLKIWMRYLSYHLEMIFIYYFIYDGFVKYVILFFTLFVHFI